jgi:hypothetical protein
MEDKVKGYKLKDTSSASIKKMIDDVFNDSELSLPQIEYVISSIMKDPMDKEMRDHFSEKIRRREQIEEGVNIISRIGPLVPISDLDLLKKIAVTKKCYLCQYRDSEKKLDESELDDPERRKEHLNELLEATFYPHARSFMVCNPNLPDKLIVQAGAPGTIAARSIKAHCLINLPEVQQAMSKILGRPLNPKSKEDLALLREIIYHTGSVVNNLGYLDRNIREAIRLGRYDERFMFSVDSLEIPKESSAYNIVRPVFDPIFRYMKRIFKTHAPA